MGMKLVVIAAVVAFGCGWTILHADAPKGNAGNADRAALTKRGEYLVNQLARCGECHTPRDARGRLDMTRHLQGAPIPARLKRRGEEDDDRAPDITMSGKAGRWGEDKMTRYLMKGEAEGLMPAYRLTREDAAAITAYLRSLPGKGGAKGDNERRKDDD